jgi:hypothetical protein
MLRKLCRLNLKSPRVVFESEECSELNFSLQLVCFAYEVTTEHQFHLLGFTQSSSVVRLVTTFGAVAFAMTSFPVAFESHYFTELDLIPY